MNSKKLLLIISAIIAISFLISGCLPNQDSNNSVGGSAGKYYSGKTGVKAEFTSLPPRVYYSEGDPENSFDFGVKVSNEGTSLARGAIYISGYDPNFLEIQGLEIQETEGWGDCTLDLTSFGDRWEDWAGVLNCFGPGGSSIQYRQDRGNVFGLNIDNLGQMLSGRESGLEGGWSWLNGLGFGFGGDWDESSSIHTLSLDLQGFADIDMTILYHGVALLLNMATFDFSSHLGSEYDLKADDQYFPGGEQDFIDYHVDMKEWPPGLDEYDIELMMVNCYGYVTYASPLVCLDPSPYSEQRKICRPKTITMSSQGAPIAITKVEQENGKNQAVFTIHVKNIGEGKVIYWGAIERCSPYYPHDLTSKYTNMIQGFNARIGNRVLTCTPETGVFRLTENGEGTITCRYDMAYSNLQSAYQAPLIMEFWYGYQETDVQRVLFKKI